MFRVSVLAADNSHLITTTTTTLPTCTATDIYYFLRRRKTQRETSRWHENPLVCQFQMQMMFADVVSLDTFCVAIAKGFNWVPWHLVHQLTRDSQLTSGVNRAKRPLCCTCAAWPKIIMETFSKRPQRKHCIHGYNVRKQELHLRFMQWRVELHASANIDTALQCYVKDVRRNC